MNAVGENLPSNAVVVISETATPLEINTVLQLEGIKHVSNTEADIQQTIQFLYPDGLPSEDEYRNNRELPSKMILCFQNDEVDLWNSRIQAMNPNEPHTSTSKDTFADIDDDKGHLRAILTTAVRRDFVNSDVPNHELILKVNDICLITRNLNALRLPSNSRVRVVRINQYSVIVTTMDDEPRNLTIPRIKFKFKLK